MIYTIKIHRFSNKIWGRYHQPWMKKFIIDLKQKFIDVEDIDYNIDGNTFKGRINMTTPIGEFGKNPPLSDVDMVVEFTNSGKYFLLTFTGNFNSYAVHYLKSELCMGIFSAHFSYHHIYDVLKKNKLLNKIDKVYPWFFGFFTEFDVDKYREIRDNTKILNDKLYFKGSGVNFGSYRETIKILSEKNMLNHNMVDQEKYLLELSKQNVGLSHYLDLNKKVDGFTHPGEMCYRDIEMISIGVPFIRMEYNSNVHNGFTPNYHYISIPREKCFEHFNKSGNEGLANLYIAKYKEIKDENDFLTYISKNQRLWYDENMRWPKSSEIIYDKLNIKKQS